MLTRTVMLPSALWDDETLGALPAEAQMLHLRLMSMKTLSAAGTAIECPSRWAYAWKLECASVEVALKHLVASGYVWVDHEGDLLLTQYAAYQKLGGQPRRMAAARDAIAAHRDPLTRALGTSILNAEVERAAGVEKPLAPIRALVFERDGWACVACGWRVGDPVPLTGTGRPLYRGLEVDHIYPKSLGGPDCESNYQTLCTSCNTRKGARV